VAPGPDLAGGRPGANQTLILGHRVGPYQRIKYASLRTVRVYYKCSQCEYNKLHHIHVEFHLLVNRMAVLDAFTKNKKKYCSVGALYW